jgi:hypothetical protein
VECSFPAVAGRSPRSYQISWQDAGMVSIWHEFPESFLILNVECRRGIYTEGPVAIRDEA